MFGNPRSFGPPQSHGSSWDEQQSSSYRPSGKAIYLQRKEYANSVSRQPDNFEYRVQHLLTLKLDREQMKDMDNCLTRLKQLDSRGRIWPQEMIMKSQETYLELCDIETKEELETMALGRIVDVQAVLDSCTYSSLLTFTMKEDNQSKMFMFQCDEAENIRDDLKSAIRHRKKEASNHLQRNQFSIRNNLENIIGQELQRSFRKSEERHIPYMAQPPPLWNELENKNNGIPPSPPPPHQQDPRGEWEESPAPSYNAAEMTVEIFNHVMNDVKIFMEKVPAATEEKKKKKKKKQKKGDAAMPPWDEFISCLEKIKFGFNIMGKVNGQISNPSAPEFVHILFSCLEFVVTHCPPDLPHSVLIPLLTEPALRLMAQVATPQEERLWHSLGDPWNIPKSKWPNRDMMPNYVPKFYDGWQLPSPVQTATIKRSFSRSNTQRHPPGPAQNDGLGNGPPTCDPAMHMRVMYDFVARNQQELSVRKGDVVQVLEQSRQWSQVQNSSNQEGYVPRNLLEPLEEHRPPNSPTLGGFADHQSPLSINEMSSPSEVRAWLEYKGFSQITLHSLGVLNGALLLGMTRNELRTVCPEEGGKVFFHLQGVKSTLALASENEFNGYRGY